MSSPLRLVRDTDPLDSALGFSGPESPLAFDGHVMEALSLASRSRRDRHPRARLPLLPLRERYAVATYLVLVLVVLLALVR